MMNNSDIDFLDKKIFKEIFNKVGYVLDFSDRTFSEFTVESVGIDIKEKYKLSKGKSLEQFIDNESDNMVLKLIQDLLYYCENISTNGLTHDKKEKLGVILKKYPKVDSGNIGHEIPSFFNSKFITSQIEIMNKAVNEHPADAIGKAKELVETCFKYVLDECNIEYASKETLLKLKNKVFSQLGISNKEEDEIHRIINGLSQIVEGINSLRNKSGTGHGKGKGFEETNSINARLAVNASETIVNFVWMSYKETS